MTDTTDNGTTPESTDESLGESLVEVGIHELSDDELVAIKEERVDEVDLDGQDVEDQAEESREDVVSREEYEKLLAQLQQKDGDLDKQLKHTKNLEKFIQRRNNEIGELRKQRAQEILTARQRLSEMALTSEEEFEERANLREAEREFDQLTEAQQELNEQGSAVQAVANFFPNDLPVNEMVQLLAEDGISEEHLREFSQNPYAVGEAALINIAKRVEERKFYTGKVRDIYSVAKQAIEALKKAEGGSSAKREVIKGINQAMKDTSYLNGASGGSRGNSRIDVTDVTKLTDEELKAVRDYGRR
jgi:hypothetical protein